MSSIYKRGKTWYIRLKDGDSWKWKSLGTTSKTRARALQAEIDGRVDRGITAFPEKPKSVDVWKFWEKYERWAKAHKRPSTITRERIFWKQFVEYTGIKSLSDITRGRIERFKSGMLENRLSKGTINNALRTLQALVNHAKKLNLYEGENAFAEVERFRLSNGVPRFLSPEQINALIQAAREDSRDALFYFALGIYAGLRKAEIDACRWEWIDLDKKTITLRSDDTFTLKDRDVRTVPMCNQLINILKPHRQETGYVIRPDKEPGQWQYRFASRKMFSRVVREAGLEWVTPHVLRHTFASTLASRNVSIFKIQQWLGHSSVNTTMVYSHLQGFDDSINVLDTLSD